MISSDLITERHTIVSVLPTRIGSKPLGLIMGVDEVLTIMRQVIRLPFLPSDSPVNLLISKLMNEGTDGVLNAIRYCGIGLVGPGPDVYLIALRVRE